MNSRKTALEKVSGKHTHTRSETALNPSCMRDMWRPPCRSLSLSLCLSEKFEMRARWRWQRARCKGYVVWWTVRNCSKHNLHCDAYIKAACPSVSFLRGNCIVIRVGYWNPCYFVFKLLIFSKYVRSMSMIYLIDHTALYLLSQWLL